MTEKLYDTDSHQRKFSARVISCAMSQKGYEAVLDRTAFFPIGGGQAADTGRLGGIRVLDVHERNGVIYHLLEQPLEEGIEVNGEIDWEKRFSRMQQHSGEHIVSGLIHSKFGYDNVGFHLGEEVCTLDVSGPLSKEEVKEMEDAANAVVFQNIPIEVLYPSKEVLAELEYRSKIEIEGRVRIVRIGEVDTCACCAPHVERTGEIGLIKLIQSQNYKGGMRLTMVCGVRALRDYQEKEQSVKAIMASLCSKEELIAESVERMKEENAAFKMEIYKLQKEILAQKACAYDGVEKAIVFETLSGNWLREFMNLILERGAKVCGVFSGNENEGYRYVLGSKREDVRVYAKRLNERFSGRGGGKPDMVQGTIGGTEIEIRKLLEEM